jgi:hypothetical protein
VRRQSVGALTLNGARHPQPGVERGLWLGRRELVICADVRFWPIAVAHSSVADAIETNSCDREEHRNSSILLIFTGHVPSCTIDPC